MRPDETTHRKAQASRAVKAARKLVAAYAVFSCLWIFLSDKAVELLFTDPETILVVSILKGVVFVAVTATLLYFLARRLLAEIQIYAVTAREALTERERTGRLLAAIVESSSDVIFAKDLTGRYLLFNREGARALGRDSASVIGKDDHELLPPEQAVRVRAQDEEILSRGQPVTYENTITTVNGKRVYSVLKGPLCDEAGKIVGVFGIARDITERKRMEDELREREERLRLAFMASNQSWFDVDLRTGSITVSPEYVQTIGYEPEEFRSDLQNWLVHVHPEDRDAVLAAFESCLAGAGPCSMEYRRRTKSGDWRWIRSIGKIVQWDENQRPLRMIGIHTDITERKEMEEQIRQLAFFDPLTRLPNRRLLYDRLERAMAASKRSGRYYALIFIDLDNFKPLNDRYGHEAGDLLLIEVAERLTKCVRETDTVARFGGDEFVILIGELDVTRDGSALQARMVAEKIRVALARPYVLAAQDECGGIRTIEHRCSASIGVVLFINHEVAPADLLKAADSAMYAAKDAGRNRIRFHDTASLPPAATD